MKNAIEFSCQGCAAKVDAALTLPFSCPATSLADDVDHLLLPPPFAGELALRGDADPFLRYRELLFPYRLARSAGLADAAWEEIVGTLDAALVTIAGTGFRATPMTEEAGLAAALKCDAKLWVKDETGNVGGSHKARHLIGVMHYLRVLQASRLKAGEAIAARRLAIASCGNAAIAAAIIARAANWPLDVFIPPDAGTAVVATLTELGATITVCARRASEAGDPCFLRFREAVQAGALPFGVQGSENGLAIEGGRTLAFEIAEAFAASGQALDAILVQVGGGALASSLAQGFALAAQVGLVARPPRLITVQAAGCAPLARAWQRVGTDVELEDAARHRSRYMWPWEATPASVAHGILDDETYDWLQIVKGMRATGGAPVVVDEEQLSRAHALGGRHTGIKVSATGSAGLAGLIAAPQCGNVAVIFSGIER